MMLVRGDEYLRVLESLHFFYQSDGFLNSASASTSCWEYNISLRVSIETAQKAAFCIMHHLSGILTEMAELSVWIGNKSLRVFDHCLYRGIRSVSCCMIDVEGLQFDVIRTYVVAGQTNDIFPDLIDFVIFLLLRYLWCFLNRCCRFRIFLGRNDS